MEKGGGGSGQLNRQTNKQTNKQKIKLIWKNIHPPRIELGTACTLSRNWIPSSHHTTRPRRSRSEYRQKVIPFTDQLREIQSLKHRETREISTLLDYRSKEGGGTDKQREGY